MKSLLKLSFILVFSMMVPKTNCNFEASQLYNMVFLGGTNTKLYFVYQTATNWWLAMDYCHERFMRPASFDDRGELNQLLDFLNATTGIPEEQKTLWISATDHRMEGTYQWAKNMDVVAFGEWGDPVDNPSANCLAINKNGLYSTHSCEEASFFPLCETPMMIPSGGEVDSRLGHETQKPSNGIRNPISQSPNNFKPIGALGRKEYFVDNNYTGTWVGHLDHCHESGMRLASPEAEPEQELLISFAESENGAGRQPLYYLAGSDLAALSCLRGNIVHRWFYSGNPIPSFGIGDEHAYHYVCVVLSPAGLIPVDCRQERQSPICEMEAGVQFCLDGEGFSPSLDCEYFYDCSGVTPLLRRCPEPTCWNQDLQLCDTGCNVTECGGRNKMG